MLFRVSRTPRNTDSCKSVKLFYSCTVALLARVLSVTMCVYNMRIISSAVLVYNVALVLGLPPAGRTSGNGKSSDSYQTLICWFVIRVWLRVEQRRSNQLWPLVFIQFWPVYCFHIDHMLLPEVSCLKLFPTMYRRRWHMTIQKSASIERLLIIVI